MQFSRRAGGGRPTTGRPAPAAALLVFLLDDFGITCSCYSVVGSRGRGYYPRGRRSSGGGGGVRWILLLALGGNFFSSSLGILVVVVVVVRTTGHCQFTLARL